MPLFFGCIRAGIVFIPGSKQLQAKDIAYRVKAARISCLVASDDVAPRVPAHDLTLQNLSIGEGFSQDGWQSYESIVNAVAPQHKCQDTKASEPLCWYFTSGSTGLPKIVEHTHVSYPLAHFYTTGKFWQDLTSTDMQWAVSDPGWAKSAWGNMFAPFSCGAGVFIYEMGTFNARVMLDILSKNQITTFCAPPTAWRQFVVQPALSQLQFPHLRHCMSAGEPLNPEVTEAWHQATGLVIREAMGQTETTAMLATPRCLPCYPGAAGVSAPGYDMRIVDDEGNELPPGQDGHIAAKVVPHRPLGLFTRYVNDEKQTKSVFVGDYYLTGDRGMQDREGYIWFSGRSDDMIISKGYRLGPFEVESILLEHAAVKEAAVIGIPDYEHGMRVKAFVIRTEEGMTHDIEFLTAELQEHCRKLTAAYKYPRVIEFVDDLPKTISGKIRRAELRAMHAATNTE